MDNPGHVLGKVGWVPKYWVPLNPYMRRWERGYLRQKANP
jgi:hypothetical protein